jgi:tocopherol cyclase
MTSGQAFSPLKSTFARRAASAALRCMVLLAILSSFPLNSFSQQATDFSIWYPLRKVFRSELYQGHNRRGNYYEGWYFKSVSPDGKHVWSLIPGIAYGKKGQDAHAFIQLIDGQTGETKYHRFPISDFHYSRKQFHVRIGENEFSPYRLRVSLGEGADQFRADLRFDKNATLASRLLRPGIMGPYRYAPFMETYHGLVSMDHEISGTVVHQGKAIDFTGGRGYIEKDWGFSMPSSWIWMQCNNFEQTGVSFMCSIARVPWLGKAFPGFLGFLLIDGEVRQFATYTGARVEGLAVQEHEVRFDIVAKEFRIEVRAQRAGTGVLQAPVAGQMDRRIAESVDANVHLRLLDNNGKELFSGNGQNAGLEVVGKLSELLED